MQKIDLSKAARDLLRRRSIGERVEVSGKNLEAYRELAGAGIMDAVSTFIGGRESMFRFTQEGWQRREELQREFPRFSASALSRTLSLAFSRIAKCVSTAR